ncbi:ArsR/SmtB family transcription factor [Methylocella silvestris]|uniref:Transcriptional regulator n=1 Tax=Methylocella silvestris TaxID=199596 RepID=A0A2J7TKR4_METSI|nr:metalloregulator ArsR/SmtB family transcription factor [Methylocella silvestris]PNG27317.1 transcriptional regulator [Methylocella silvestris]
MESETAIERLAALAQATRLDVFRLLVRHEPDGLSAGEIARRIGVPHNTLSTHFSILARAGLIRAERQSRSIIYRADLGAIGRLAAYLVEDCCGGRPGACGPFLADLARLDAS